MIKISQDVAEQRTVNLGLKLLSSYRTSTTKSEFLCGCGNKFIATPHKVWGGLVNSCGCKRKHCAVKDLTNIRYGKLIPLYLVYTKNGSAFWMCECDCGNLKIRSAQDMKAGKVLSCGCLIKNKGGSNISKNKLLLRKWSKTIYKKFNYTCNICNRTRCKVCAHHMNSINKYPEQIYNIDNGVCLCEIHHKEFHKIYGGKNNTMEQYLYYHYNKYIDLYIDNYNC